MAEIVKYRTVQIVVYPWTHPSGREYWRYKAGDKHVTRSTLEKACKDARTHAIATFKGAINLSKCTPAQLAAMQRMIAADPSCRLVDEYLVWHSKRAPRKNAKEAVAEFLAEKESNRSYETGFRCPVSSMSFQGRGLEGCC